MTATSESVPAEPRRLYRTVDGRLVSGVAAGLAKHLGLAAMIVRAAFIALTFAGGIGVLAYVVLWAYVPQQGDEPSDEDEEWGQLLAGAILAAGVALGMYVLGFDITGPTGLPTIAVVVGAALMWRQADAAQRARWRASAASRRGHVVRIVGGAVLLVSGLIGFLASRGQLSAARQGVVATLVVLVGVALMSGPWWLRMTTELRSERRERIRSQERAEVAAHVHDSVLQTLALIRKSAADPREVTRLARSQERELRDWLYQPSGSPPRHLAAAIGGAAADVEEAHGTPVEVVVVGDCPADERVDALLAATREAMVNAAVHSGAADVSVYAEVEPTRVTVFVRDKGRGFDVDAVPAGRFGLAQSIHGRMARHGGSAEVRSVPGEGTDVRLEVPRG